MDMQSTAPLVVGVFEEGTLSCGAQQVEKATAGALMRAIQSHAFKGKEGETLTLVAPTGVTYSAVTLIGLGKADALTPQSLEEIGAKLYAAVAKTQSPNVMVDLTDTAFTDGANTVAFIASGAMLRAWSFPIYKTKTKEEVHLKTLTFITPDVTASQKAFEPLQALAEGVFLTRHVVSEPPNVLYPQSMAQIAKDELRPLGVKVEVLDEKDMTKLGMGALLGVGQGSEKESQLIVLQWQGGPKDQKPIAIVGKGVTFDTGGISIKPSNNMEDMKYDMAGSGVVLGLLKALALRNARVNVVGIMGMVENMPSGSAQRPADVVTSMSGQTIEVVNTDAEGRLVLADALWYAQSRFKPQAMIDLATLTGAITVALGEEYAGLFSNDDALATNLLTAAKATGECAWRMPLCESYDKDINSDIADMKNVGSGRGAGSATAAHFLQRFVNDVPWAHLDIAGMAWNKRGRALCAKGATGYGVRLLDAFIRSYEA
jgi:leucyl aminopeptidase